MAAVETTAWYEALNGEERTACAEELTDAYFAALSSGAWEAFQAIVRQWFARAADKQFVSA